MIRAQLLGTLAAVSPFPSSSYADWRTRAGVYVVPESLLTSVPTAGMKYVRKDDRTSGLTRVSKEEDKKAA